MKTITQTLIFIAFIAISFSSNAQIKFAAKTGINVSTLRLSDNEESNDLESTVGYTLGVTGEYSFSEKMSFQSGLMWSQRGAKQTDKDSGISTENKLTLNYIEVPMNFIYKINAFQLYAGPYVSFATGGKFKTEVSGFGQTKTEEEDVNFGSGDNDDYKGTDLGLNLGAGYQFGKILVNAGFSVGLNNINASSNDSKIKNSAFTLGVSYFFGAR